jgi:hypothetical protein
MIYFLFRRLWLLCCCLVVGWQVHAQQSGLRNKQIIVTNDTIRLDTVSIIPGSLVVTGFDTSYFTVNELRSWLLFKKKLQVSTVQVQYRVWPMQWYTPYATYKYDSIVNRFVAAQPTKQRNSDDRLFNFGNLQYNGSFGRSLSFGNNQDAVFNSQLNLQLSGYIADSIQLLAAITDNNIPIQPDGTTQQLNEFDRILLQFQKQQWSLSLGDIDVRQNQHYFLNFYKRLQGVQYAQQWRTKQQVTGNTMVTGAIAKGKFARYVFQGAEGNQGPYRLQSPNGELFLVVLANTERVFMDGELLQRGEDQDYTINYNTAEVTFTPRRMITKDKRIQIEFEYADRNYLNSMLYATTSISKANRWKVSIAAYSNTDAKNSPINQSLDNAQKQFLAATGDSIQSAFYPVASIDTLAVGKILYKKIFVTYTGGSDSVYVYSTNRDSAKYNLNFINVGANKGNYIPLLNAANGKVYQWVAPVNGIPQGSYEPATFLVTPKQQQLATIVSEFNITSNLTVKAEAAVSKYDINRFATKQKQNDVDAAGRLAIQHAKQLRQWQLTTTAQYEWVGKNFSTIERLRAPEFYRDWGLPILLLQQVQEQLPALSITLKKQQQSIGYQYQGYIRGDGFNANRHTLTHQLQQRGWDWNANMQLTNSNTEILQGRFIRPTIQISKLLPQLKQWQVGATYALENYQQRYLPSDTLTPLSFMFETITAFIKSDVQKRNRWELQYFTRKDGLPLGSNLQIVDRSHNYNAQLWLMANPKHQLRMNVTYRTLQVYQSKLSSQNSDNTLLSRIEYMVNEWKGLLTGSLLYEVGTGQEQRRDISYVEVPAGRGEYTWIDYNNDGIPQLNEFEIAQFPDQAKYIRIFTPTNTFIKASYNQFNYAINIQPRALWAKSNNWYKQLFSRTQLTTTMQLSQKAVSNGNALLNPFTARASDTSLIAYNVAVSNTLGINRFSTKWGIDITNIQNTQKALLTYGTETRTVNEWIVKGRTAITTHWLLEAIHKTGTQVVTTPSFANRNFNIQSQSIEPRITYTAGTMWRVLVSYQYVLQKNTLTVNERSNNNTINGEFKYNATQKTSLLVRGSYNNILFDGAVNSTTGFVLLNGLLPGKNYLWGVELTQRLMNNLELTLQYDGRKPAATRTIHRGSAAIRALL